MASISMHIPLDKVRRQAKHTATQALLLPPSLLVDTATAFYAIDWSALQIPYLFGAIGCTARLEGATLEVLNLVTVCSASLRSRKTW